MLPIHTQRISRNQVLFVHVLFFSCNHRTQNVLEEVRAATGRRGVNVIVDHVGAATFLTSLKSLAPGGRLTVCGATSGPETAIDIRYIYGRRLSIYGTWMGTKQEMRDLLPLVDAGRLRPIIHAVLPLEEAAEAHRMMEESAHFGKIVLKVG